MRQENKLCAVWSLICHATVSHVDLSVDLIEVEFERVRSYLCFVAYSRCVVMSFRSCVVFVFKDMAEHRSVVVYLTIYSQLRWKHEDLKRRREAFGMIHFVWVCGIYDTFAFLQNTRSSSSFTPFSHMNVVSRTAYYGLQLCGLFLTWT